MIGTKLFLFMIFCTLLPAFASAQGLEQRSPGVCDSGFVSLFNGKTLDGWKVTDFGTQGDVTIEKGTIVLGMGDGCTGITLKKDFPEINYEVTLQAEKIDGDDFFCGMTFPVGKSPCTLIVGGWGGTVVGLSSIDGLDASENETGRLKKFSHNRWYKIRLRVTRELIQAWIDGQKMVDLPIKGKELSIRPEVELSKPFGIASWKTTAALRNICVRKIK